MKWFGAKKDTWQLSKMTRDGRPIGTQLLRINPSTNRRAHPHLIYFTVSYEGGHLPSPSDFDRFDIIDDELIRLDPILGFAIVATITTGGKRDWVIYAKDAETVMSGLFRELGEHSPQMETQPDPSWIQYKDLVKMAKL